MKSSRKRLKLSKQTISNLDIRIMGRVRAGGGGEPDDEPTLEDLLFADIPIVITNCEQDLGCGSNAGNYGSATVQIGTATLGSAVTGATTVSATITTATI